MFVRSAFGACIIACFALVGAASAANRKVNIVNQTGMALKHFYASTPEVETWEEDILGREVLNNGETFEADINDGTGACVFDFKAVFADGQSLIRKGVNVCEVASFTYQ